MTYNGKIYIFRVDERRKSGYKPGYISYTDKTVPNPIQNNPSEIHSIANSCTTS